MKKILSIILLLVAALGWSFGVRAEENPLFTYPTPPESMVMLQDRSDYFVSHFWQRCNFEQAVLHPAEFTRAFGDWIAVMPYASADTVYRSIDNLLGRFTRKGDITLALAREAERRFYADSADYASDELYLPFARAAATHRKIDRRERDYFAAQVRILESSSQNGTVPPLPFERPDGSKGNLGEINDRSMLLIFDDGNCVDCTLARIRLSTDPDTRALVERGELAIITIYPAAADDAWRRRAEGFPAEWINVAIADAPAYFRLTPGETHNYYLNSHRKVLLKDLDAEYILGAFRMANQRPR